MNKNETVVVNETADTEKRGRIILLSLLIALSMFVVKMSQNWGVEDSWLSYLVAGIYMIFTFVGLMWAFSFQIKPKSIPCLAQSSLFVASEFLFIEMFFFSDIGRIYEALLLLGMLGVIWVVTYVSFLMSNIFNVGLYRDIPLEQVARTASYILSLFMSYFLTFSILANGLELYVLLPSVLIAYLAISAMHIRNLEFEKKDFRRRTMLTTVIMYVLFLGSFLIGARHELVSIVPTVGFFASVGGMTKNFTEKESKRLLLIYGALILIVFIINVVNNL